MVLIYIITNKKAKIAEVKFVTPTTTKGRTTDQILKDINCRCVDVSNVTQDNFS